MYMYIHVRIHLRIHALVGVTGSWCVSHAVLGEGTQGDLDDQGLACFDISLSLSPKVQVMLGCC